MSPWPAAALTPLELQLLALLAALLALNMLVWRCNRGTLSAVYTAPHLFSLDEARSPRADGIMSARSAANPSLLRTEAQKRQ